MQNVTYQGSIFTINHCITNYYGFGILIETYNHI